MRILVFSKIFYPHGSGAELATWLYLKLLAERGFRITVVTKRFPEEPSSELLNGGIKIFRIPIRNVNGRYDTLISMGSWANIFIRKLIKDNDVIYIPNYWIDIIPLAKLHRKPVIVHMHGYPLVCPTSLMYDFVKQTAGVSSPKSFILHEIVEKKRKPLFVFVSSLINELFGRYYNKLGMLADAIIFVSEAQRDMVLSKIPVIKEKSYMLYNPIPNRPLVEAKRKGIGYFGGKSFVKGFNIFMRALTLQKYEDMEVYLTRISDYPKKLRLENGVCLNLLPKVDDIGFIMEKLAIVIIPSIWPEPAPYALVESMLYGKVIVATAVGGIPELVNEVYSGVKLIKPLSCWEIVESLKVLSGLKLEKLNELGIKNREYVIRKFDNERTIESFIDILEKTCD